MLRVRLFSLLIVLALLSLIAVPATAQRPDAPQYAQRGPYAVGTRDFEIDDGQGLPLTATVWYPALNPDGVEEQVAYQVAMFTLDGHALLDAPPDPAGGPYPLVVFSHGSRGIRVQSLFLTEHLASYGMVVIAVDHPGNTTVDWLLNREDFGDAVLTNFANRPYDVLRAIQFIDELVATNDAIGEIVDPDQLAIVGHSFGGYTALAVGGARLDLAGLHDLCAENSGFVPSDVIADVPMPRGADTDQERMQDYSCGLDEVADDIAALRGLDETPTGLWPATADPRVDALVLMAPATAHAFGPQGLAEVSAPTLVLVGSEDQSTYPPADAYPAFEQISSTRKGLAVFENAGHYIFVDDCPQIALNFGLFGECSDQVWDMARIHDLINHLTTAFLLETFAGEAEASAVLAADAVDFPGVYYRTIP